MSLRAADLTKHWPLVQAWSGVHSRGAVAMTLAALVGATLLALLARPLIGHQPLYDELLHVLSARGLLATGQPVIGDGIYERAELYTQLVALAFRQLGDTLVAARIPSLISAMALVALAGAWVVRRAGLVAGCATALLLTMNPWTLELAVFARFYTLHALAVLVMFIALYEAFARDRRPQVRGLFSVIAATAAAVAWHLQITTIVAIGAASAGVTAILLVDHREPLMEFARKRAILAGVTLVIVVALVAWVTVELGLVDRFGTAPAWASNTVNAREYYNAALTKALPLLWPLMPVAFLAALFVDRRLAIFCAVAALAGFLVHSMAAQKATRYAYYLLPLLCVLWGIGIAKGAQLLGSLGARLVPAVSRVSGALALGLIAVMLVNSTEGRLVARILAGREGAGMLSYANEADWSKAGPGLRVPRAKSTSTIASNSMKALYFMGDYDLELNASIVAETDTGAEFGVDSRTGRRVISSAESITRVLDESPGALVVVENEKLRRHSGVPAAVVDVLDARCARVDLLKEGGVVAWTCEAPAAADACEDCAPSANSIAHPISQR